MGSSKKVTVGYKYLLGMHMVLCHGPIDRVLKLRWDDRNGWTGSSTGGEITVDAENLFGGKSREGGVSGRIDFEQGGPVQGRNSYLQSKLGALIPAFRGVASLVLKQVYLGMNPYLKTMSVIAQRMHVRQDGQPQWYDEKAEIVLIAEGSAPYDELLVDEITLLGTSASTTPATAYMLTGGFTAADTIVLKKKSGAYSGFASDGAGGVPPGGAWTNRYRVSANAVGLGTSHNAPDYLNQAAAEAAGFDVESTHTGAALYGVFLYDDNPPDNRGTLTLSAYLRYPGTPANTMNPAHIIRECDTDPTWGMGYPEDSINDAAFQACADQLYVEGMGMSLLWDQQQPIEEFVQVVCNHVDATHYVDRDGKWTLKLIRDDYDVGTLITLNPSNVERIENASRPSFGELVNSVTVNYVDGATFKPASITVGDPALSQAQGAVINTTVQYPGFISRALASRVASRDLKALSTPLFSCTLYANREAAELQPGGVFKLSWPDYEIDALVMRVTKIGLGDGRSNQVRITCVEDVFSVPSAAVQSPGTGGGGWQDPSQPPQASPAVLAFEVPYYELVQVRGQTAVDADLAAHPESGIVGAAAVRPAGSAINAAIYTDAGAGYQDSGTLDFCGSAVLGSAIGKLDSTVDLLGGVDLDTVAPGTHAQIGDELVAVDSIVGATMTFRRGVLDTVPADHGAGDRAFFWDEYSGAAQSEYVAGETVDVRVLPANGLGELPLASAGTHSVLIAGRAFRPYPPGNFRINGDLFPALVEGVIDVTWSHRDRLQQTAGALMDFTDGDIGPEASTTYTVRLLTADHDVLLDEASGLIGTNHTLSGTFTGEVYLQLWSVRDGLSSWQIHEHRFTYLGTGARAVEPGGAYRLAESGDYRVQE